MQLCIEKLLYRIKLSEVFILGVFFCLADIYRPSLGKVQLGKPNPNQSQSLNFYLRKKKKILLRIVVLQCITALFSILIFIYF